MLESVSFALNTFEICLSIFVVFRMIFMCRSPLVLVINERIFLNELCCSYIIFVIIYFEMFIVNI